MIDYHKELVSALNTVLPAHYEMTLTSDTKTPCISYMEVNNYVVANGDTLGYSGISYQVKVWGKELADLQKYAKQIDDVLRPIGFTRTSTNELSDNKSGMIQKIMSYEGMALETF